MKDKQEIIARISELNDEIEKELQPQFLVLNKEIERILAEITQIQNECSHEYEEGYCSICGRSIEEELI